MRRTTEKQLCHHQPELLTPEQIIVLQKTLESELAHVRESNYFTAKRCEITKEISKF